MLIYYILVFFILLLQIKIWKNSANRLRYSISLILLFFVAALRGNGDGDYFVYLQYAELINSTTMLFNNSFPMEFGFRLISYIVNVFGINTQLVISLMNLISISCISIFIKRHSPDKLLSVFLFLPIFFMFDMHAARTAVALSICTLGFQYLVDKKYIKFMLVIFIGTLFHNIAAILIVLIFLEKLKIHDILYYLTILGAFLVVKLLSINSIVISILNLVGLSNLASRFYIYMNNSTYGYEFSLLDPRLILSLMIFVFSMIIKNYIELTRIENLLIKINWFLLILMIIFSSNTIFVVRLYGLINIYSIIQLPIFLKRYKQIAGYLSYFVAKILIIIAYIFYLLVLINGYPEYIFFFNK